MKGEKLGPYSLEGSRLTLKMRLAWEEIEQEERRRRRLALFAVFFITFYGACLIAWLLRGR
jgi:hypothetical protein